MHRLFWTWDHSMDWAPLADGVQEMGCANPYFKKPEDFVSDYRRLIDFAASLGFTGVIVWGLLRDRHGGLDAAREICRYGRDKGVAILAGAGVYAYGGVYWEGDHEFNLLSWLERHPDLEAVDAMAPSGDVFQDRSPYLRMACPSKPANRRWQREAIAWLCETLEIGGIDFETGDYGTCRCEDCLRRFGPPGRWSFGVMADVLPELIETALRTRPGLLPICECYFDNILDVESFHPLRSLPGEALLAFTINREFWPRVKQELDAGVVEALPPHRKLLRTHMGCQWNAERHAFVARSFAEFAQKAHAVNFDGVTVFGEVSARQTASEINYRALAAWADEPGLVWESFVSTHLGPLLGGPDLARQYVRLLERPQTSEEDLRSACGILRGQAGATHRRWLWLVEQLYHRLETP